MMKHNHNHMTCRAQTLSAALTRAPTNRRGCTRALIDANTRTHMKMTNYDNNAMSALETH